MSRFTRIIRPTNPSRKTRPNVENLEARQLMYATTGDHFTYGNGIRFSIVPDGTSVNGKSSNL